MATRWRAVVEQCRLKSFFTKSTGDNLWKGVTSVSNVGRKKGRARSVARRKDLNRGQRIGEGAINTLWPGLNAPVMTGKNLLTPRYLPPDAERQEKLLKLREAVRTSRAKLHPLERGWSGTSLMGRVLSPPACLQDEEAGKEFKTIVLQTKSVRHMTARLGLVRRISLLAIVGNGQGLAGFAFAKQPDAKAALRKASNMAAKRLVYVDRLDERTVYQDFWAECRSTQVFVQRTADGYGLRCHRALTAICQAIGIKDLYASVEGNTANYLALTKAFFDGLLKQRTFRELAEQQRMLVVEFSNERDYFPVVVARPSKLQQERRQTIDVDELFASGRYPYQRPERQPFWINFDSYKRKLWLERPYRNHDDVKIRLLADDVIADYTVEQLKKRAADEQAKVDAGLKAIPMGIGLTSVLPR